MWLVWLTLGAWATIIFELRDFEPLCQFRQVTMQCYGPKTQNLVVARTSVLQVYELKTVPEDGNNAIDRTNGNRTDGQKESPANTYGTPLQNEHLAKLVLISESDLLGTITSIARVNLITTKTGGDALLVSFRDAKVSLIEWDPEIHDFSTISIHMYEGDDIQEAPWYPDVGNSESYLSVDPSNRCAALKFGQRTLAILPFRQTGDDLADGDYGAGSVETSERATDVEMTNGANSEMQSPYLPSFVLPVTVLDPQLTHLVHLAFLHEYREPTFGILSSSKTPSISLLQERKDPLSYSVFTLDLEQRASTTLLTVTGLPYDLFEIVPLPAPVEGVLLVGGNEIIHVDQAGKTNAIAVNEFSRQSSSFPMNDQSSLALRLEGSVAVQLDTGNGEILLMLRSGGLLLVLFRLDGRSVSGVSARRVSPELGGELLKSGPSCAAHLSSGHFFVGMEQADSVLMWYSTLTPFASRKRSHIEISKDRAEESFDDQDDQDDEDDIYGSPTPMRNGASHPSERELERFAFSVHDTLFGLAPLKDLQFSNFIEGPNSLETAVPKQDEDVFELFGAYGSGKGSGLMSISRHINLEISNKKHEESIKRLWSLHVKGPTAPAIEASQEELISRHSDASNHHNLLFVASSGDHARDSCIPYKILQEGVKDYHESKFQGSHVTTIDIDSISDGSGIVQVLHNEVWTYDVDLCHAERIYSIAATVSQSPVIVSSMTVENFVLLIKDDGTATVLEINKSGDNFELKWSEDISPGKWNCGCLYKSQFPQEDIYACLASEEGGFSIFALPSVNTPVFQAENLNLLPHILAPEQSSRRSSSSTKIEEVIVTDIGDNISQTTCLCIRSTDGRFTIYKAYNHTGSRSTTFTAHIHWIKIPLPDVAVAPNGKRSTEVDTAPKLKSLQLGEHRVVCYFADVPRMIIKTSSSSFKILPLSNRSVIDISPYHTSDCTRGAAIAGDDSILFCSMPKDYSFSDTGFSVKRTNIGVHIDHLNYITSKKVAILGTSSEESFQIPDDDWHWEGIRDDNAFRPSVERGKIKLFHPKSSAVIDELELEHAEVVTCMETLSLEVSEITHERRFLTVVGTALRRGEDSAAKGRVYVLDIIKVVPEPGRPETGHRFKLLVEKEVKGAVTALCGVGSQGFLLEAQGQKCMIRGLKEDDTLLPVAFIDMQCYVTVARELSTANLLLLGDAIKGIWLVGFTEEPYKLIPLGKWKSTFEVVAAEFLPHQQQLHVVVADADCNIHVLQFDPENPRSLSGQRLIHKGTFHTGQFCSSFAPFDTASESSLNASSDTSLSLQPNDDQKLAKVKRVLVTTQSGALGLITPINEQQYRRFSALQTHLTNTLEHPCGLNPKAYRATESDGFNNRSMIDGNLVRRWLNLGTQRQAEACAKVGVDEWVLRNDLAWLYTPTLK